MASLNSFARAATRPSVREIAASIFQPSYRCCARSRQAVSRTSSPRRAAFSSNRCPVARKFSSTTYRSQAAKANPPISTDRGPTSSETTQTDFNQLDVLGNTPIPSTNIDACLWDGFHLNNGVKITEGAGVLLVAGEAFSWRPWETDILGSKRLLNDKGQWEVGDDAWGVLGMVWPKPDLLILGLGPSMAPLSPSTRKYINSLGIRIDIQDTRNASAQYNLLATERGLGTVAAALIPLGWREGVGVKSSK